MKYQTSTPIYIKENDTRKAFSVSGICFVLLILCLTSCKKFVEVPAPITQLVTTTVFNDNNSATAAQLYIYANMQGYPIGIDWTTACSSDELFTYATDQYSKDVYANALNASTDATAIGFWQPFYGYIYDENAVIENLKNSGGVSLRVKQQLTGEAEFMRAYFYFYLVNMYGDVPLVLSTDYKTNSSLPRTPKSQIYQQMVADLENANTLLSSNYVDATDTTTTIDKARPNTWAASALLARVYLYSGMAYDKAEAAATTVINNTKYGLSPLSGANSVFTANSSEAIWQIIPPTTNAWAAEGFKFVLLTAPGSSGANSTISSQLMAAFEPGDLRKTNWIGTFTSGSSTWYYPYKYKLTNTATKTPSGEYSMILRLAEQYLIRAEARAQQNNLSGAISDLNIIRTRAGLSNLSPTLSQAQVLTAVAHERQVELFTEGHRWFDLQRTNQLDLIMPAVTSQKGGTWQSYQQLYPIPLEVIQNSTNVAQNVGY